MTELMGKLNSNLRRIYNDFLRTQAGQQPLNPSNPDWLNGGDAYFVMVQHTGNLAELEALGLTNTTDLGETLASGEIQLQNLEQLASSTTVVHIEYGSSNEPLLDTSVPEVKADQVWTLNKTTGVFGSGETGAGVVIGIIDSGIDIYHTDFQIALKETRIKRIWDPGLDPEPGESSPELSLLAPGRSSSYGVEYTEDDINTHLQGGVQIRHRDCSGHGTHVASIAAGNGQTKNRGETFKFVGVAPEANLVIVKIFNLEKDNPPAFSQRFIDAVHYIENVVKTDNELKDQPFVINYSGGSSTGPHDGLTSQEVFLTNHFRDAKGKVFVTAGGNSANLNRHAVIRIPSGGSIEVPFTLEDNRASLTDFRCCVEKDNTLTLRVDIWYRDVVGVKVEVKLPTDRYFWPQTDANNDSVEVVRGDLASGFFDSDKYFELSNAQQSVNRPAEPTANPPIQASTLHRSQIQLAVKPPDKHLHATGDYVLRISGPEGTELHAWCSGDHRQFFMIRDQASAPPAIEIKQTEDLIGTPAGARHVLTVAAYDNLTGNIFQKSSRGGLVDYAGVGNLAVKPDLSAPGEQIEAAMSSAALFANLWGELNPDYVNLTGTSMAAPHVSGAVALMLQKKNDLDLTDIYAILGTIGQGIRSASPAKDFGAGKLDVKGAIDNVP